MNTTASHIALGVSRGIGHVLFLFIHAAALLLFFPAIFITIPIHIVFTAM